MTSIPSMAVTGWIPSLSDPMASLFFSFSHFQPDSQTLFSPRPRQHSVPGQGPGTGTGSGTGCMSPSTSTLHDSFYTVSDPATASHPVSAFISPGNMRSNLPLPLPLASSSSLPLNVVLPLSLSSKSGRDATCSLAEEDFSDFNFWKIPHVSLA